MRKTKIYHIVLALALAAGLQSCNLVQTIVHDDDVVAQVGSVKLYRSEMEKFIPGKLSPEDSAAFAARYINTWALDRLYMSVAEAQLSKAEMDVSEELESYRRSLIKYRYEQRYINERLDTLITDAQIERYYEEHEEDFVLPRPILKIRFVDVMKDSPNKDAILRMLASSDYDDTERLDTLAASTALKFFDSSDTWMDAAELARSFGVDYTEMLAHLSGNMIKIEPEGRGDLLAAYVCDIQRTGVAPIEYCSGRIRDIILSGRKHELVKNLERDLLANALESKEFIIQ